MGLYKNCGSMKKSAEDYIRLKADEYKAVTMLADENTVEHVSASECRLRVNLLLQ